MSLMKSSSDFPDFERFFYDQVVFRTDFFEKPNPKIERKIRISELIFKYFTEFREAWLLLAKAAIYITLVLENITKV